MNKHPIILHIKVLLSTTKLLHREIANMFDVNRKVISDINRGSTWAWLKPDVLTKTATLMNAK